MARTNLNLKTQTELLADMEARMTDTGNTLATDAQYYAGLSEGIRMWEGRVAIPKIHSITGGFTSGVFEYTLPSYIRPPFTVQIKTSTFAYLGAISVEQDDYYTWETFAGWEIEPKADGTWLLRLATSPYTQDGRIIWFADNGPLPGTVPTLTSGCDADDTTIALTVTAGPDLLDSGYFKVDSEWIGYSGLTRTSSTSYTVNNCVRALYGTTAATHNAAASAPWGVGVDTTKLWVQLYDYTASYVHALQLHKGTTEDTSRHEKLMSFYQTKSENFWRNEGYVSQRKPRRLLDARTLGNMTW